MIRIRKLVDQLNEKMQEMYAGIGGQHFWLRALGVPDESLEELDKDEEGGEGGSEETENAGEGDEEESQAEETEAEESEAGSEASMERQDESE